MLHTTFNRLKLAGACGQKRGSGEGYDKLATYLGGSGVCGKDTPIPLAVVVESNGLPDALWCLRATVEDFWTVVHPFIRSYLADVLEHIASRTSAKTKSLLDDAHTTYYVADAVYANVTNAADATTYDAAIAVADAVYADAADAVYVDVDDAADATTYDAAIAHAADAALVYTADAAADAAIADAAFDADVVFDAAAAFETAFYAERKWQTEQFLSALQGG